MLNSARKDGKHFLFIFCKSSLVKGKAYFLKKVVVKPKIVHNRQSHPQHFLYREKMPDVSSAEIFAGGAMALTVDRPGIEGILGIVYVDNTLFCEKVAVTAVAARHNAVEKVHSPFHRLKNICRRTDTHKIAYLIIGSIWLHRRNNAVHILGRFTHRKTADGVSVKIQLCNLLHILDS